MTASAERPELPELQQTRLDEETLDALIRDIEQCAAGVEVIVKPTTRDYAIPDTISPSQALLLLKQGCLRGVQIRYRFQGDHWVDTLISSAGQVQLTRIKLTVDVLHQSG